VRAKSRGRARNRPRLALDRRYTKHWDTIQTPRPIRRARTDRQPPTSLPCPRRRTQLRIGFARLTSTRSSIATVLATPSTNSLAGSQSTGPPSSPTSTAEASNDALPRSSGTTRHLPPPLAATPTVPHSPTSPHNLDSTRQPSPTVSAKQESRPDPDKAGTTARVMRSAKCSGNLARPDRGLEASSRRILPGRRLVRTVRRHVAEVARTFWLRVPCPIGCS
jgi:hypothetical protein